MRDGFSEEVGLLQDQQSLDYFDEFLVMLTTDGGGRRGHGGEHLVLIIEV